MFALERLVATFARTWVVNLRSAYLTLWPSAIRQPPFATQNFKSKDLLGELVDELLP